MTKFAIVIGFLTSMIFGAIGMGLYEGTFGKPETEIERPAKMAADLKQAQDELGKLKETHQVTRAKVAELEGIIASRNNSILVLERVHEQLKKQLADVRPLLEAGGAAAKQLEEKIREVTALERRAAAAEKALAAKEDAYTALIAKSATHTTEIADLQQRLKACGKQRRERKNAFARTQQKKKAVATARRGPSMSFKEADNPECVH